MKLSRLILPMLVVAVLWSPTRASAARYWIYFTDKGCQTTSELNQAIQNEQSRLLPRTRQRLHKVHSSGDLISECDLPVSDRYLRTIETISHQKPHAVSRILNAASFNLSQRQIITLKCLSFIKDIQPVHLFRKDSDLIPAAMPPKSPGRTVADSAFYGDSYLQNRIENFPPAHDAGFNGRGVLVGMLDAGWDTLGHPCFDSLEIVATWDFVNGDSSVANDPGQMGIGSHGTATLSCMAAYDPGELIGTAYGISVALAKTENTEGELPIEEDNWIAGIEWLDSLGCQVVSSSLSYYGFDNGFSYTYADLNGNTAPITIAADYEVSRGIVVVNSMGNRGNYAYPLNKMKAPADGDSVLSIGAIEASDSSRASFSSMGPTYDGRIKPDLVALGNSVKVAVKDFYLYSYSSGTSVSTPLTAGACALILQANPNLTPMQVQWALKNSASHSEDPDTLTGWGVYNVWAAVQEVLSAVPRKEISILPSNFGMMEAFPNPFNAIARIYLTTSSPGKVTLSVYDPAGRQLGKIADGYLNPGRHDFNWDAGGFPSGVYFLRATTPLGIISQKAILLK